MAKSEIHIATVGENIAHVVRGVFILEATELYLITSEIYKRGSTIDSITRVEKELEQFPIKVNDKLGTSPLLIDPFQNDSFEKIVEIIIDIMDSRKGENADFYVNITGGTNLMTAAAAAAANLTGTIAYYVLRPTEEKEPEKEIIKIPPHVIDSNLHERRKRILEILFSEGESNDSDIFKILRKENKELSERQIRYPLEQMEKDGYITRTRKGRYNINSLTVWGRIAIKLLGNKK